MVFMLISLQDSDDSTSTAQTDPLAFQLEKLTENLTLCSSNTLPKQLTSSHLSNQSSNLRMTTTSSWTYKTPSSARPPLCQTSKTTTSPKNFVKPFNYVPPKTVSPKQQAKNNNCCGPTITTTVGATVGTSFSLSSSSNPSCASQMGEEMTSAKDEEDNDSAVSSMTSSNVETPPVAVEIYSPPSLNEEPPPLPPKPAFMKGHCSPEKTNACSTECQDQTQSLIRGVEDHVYTEANKAKFQRSLPDLNKKKSNLKNKTLDDDLCSNSGNAKIVSFNPNVRERTRSSSLPRCNSKDDFTSCSEGGENSRSVVEPEYQFRKSHYKPRSKCSRRSRRHGQLHHYHQYYHHYKQHHYNHSEYCSDPEECTAGGGPGSDRFSALPWEYYSDSSSSTSSSSDDDVSTPGFINPPPPSGASSFLHGTGNMIGGGASASMQRQRRRHRRSKKNKCKIS